MSILKVAIILCCASAPLHAQEWIKQERVDVRPDGQGSTSPYSLPSVSISDDGRWVVFASYQSDLVLGDTNGANDIFVRDRVTQTTRRISVLPDGSQIPTGGHLSHASRDARFISFYTAGALVPEDTNSAADIYLLDRDSDANGVFDEVGATTLRRVSVDASGAQSPFSVRDVQSAVSDDGMNVAFATTRALVPGDDNGKSDVYVRDLAQPATRIMSNNAGGILGDQASPAYYSRPVRISSDGRLVAFNSDARNLVSGDTNSTADVFVRDRDSDGNGIFDEPGGTSIRRATMLPGGGQTSGDVERFYLAGKGEWLTFSYFSSADNNPGSDIYLNKLSTNTVTRINFDAAVWKKGDGSCCGNSSALLSEDGNLAIFQSTQNYSLPVNTQATSSDWFSWTRGSGLMRISNFVPPATLAETVTHFPNALSANGKYAVVLIYAESPTNFVYSRNTVFTGSFDTVD